MVALKVTLAFSFCVFFLAPLAAQQDTQSIKNLYDRVLEFDESKLDSIRIYANQIEKNSQNLAFDKGELLSARLKGIHAEYNGDFQSAINYYLRCLEISREKKLEAYEASALSDLAYMYTILRNPAKAKDYYLQTADMALKRGEVSAIVTDLSNLGAIYNKLNQPDSALYFLEQAEKAASGFSEQIDMTSLMNNMGNAWFQKKDWQKALAYFRGNYVHNKTEKNKDVLWYDVLNLSDVFIELRQFDSSRIFLDSSLLLARELKSLRKEADVHQLYAKYHYRRNNYKAAYEELQLWNRIDTSLVNAETRSTILEMEEKFHSRQRQQENKLLMIELEAGRLRTRNLSIVSLGIAVLAIVTGIYFYLIRRKNKHLEDKNLLIQEQNSRLADLNTEKNSLISVVSHDLNTPFSSIKMWLQLMEAERNGMSGNQVKALERIKSSVDSGLTLIRNILDVERAETNSQVIRLEKTNIAGLVKEVVDDHLPAAEQKEIRVIFDFRKNMQEILTDQGLLKRVCANLMSNAIKFTPPGKQIFVTVSETETGAQIEFRDEGQGIPKDEMKFLFSKYSRISTVSTAGETSTGLGLSIVKRILTELNGTVSCESQYGSGATFTVKLPR